MIEGVDWDRLSASANRVEDLIASGQWTYARFLEESREQAAAVEDCSDEEAAGELTSNLDRVYNPDWAKKRNLDKPYNPWKTPNANKTKRKNTAK